MTPSISTASVLGIKSDTLAIRVATKGSASGLMTKRNEGGRFDNWGLL